MAQTLSWLRPRFHVTTPSYYGYSLLVDPDVGQTVRRVHWAWQAHQVFVGSSGWPPGSGITQVGLVWTDQTGSNIPTPLSQPEADWIALENVRWDTELSRTTDIVWEMHSTFPQTSWDTQSMRKQVPTNPVWSLYMSWETEVASDTASPFNYAAWGTASVLLGTDPS